MRYWYHVNCDTVVNINDDDSTNIASIDDDHCLQIRPNMIDDI